jgi:mono/diheme cytochrome c family protein
VISRVLTMLLCVLAPPLAAQSNGGTERTLAGAFSDEQVRQGDQTFQSYCLSCHTPTFHTGEQFRMSWFGRTVYDYFKVVKTTMPEDNPGGLTDDEYTRVITYIFKMNGFPAGADALPTDTLVMKSIRIAAPPPPASADSVHQRRR